LQTENFGTMLGKSIDQIAMKTSGELGKKKKSGRRDFLKISGLSIAANLVYTALPPSV
jgi:hypothetical protein